MKELVRALALLAEPPAPEAAVAVGAAGLDLPEAWEFDELLVQQLYPYASVYLGAEGQLGGDARDRVAGIWRVLGQEPPSECDHLALLLGLYARLLELEEEDAPPGADAWRPVRVGLLHEHLTSWLPLWLARAVELGEPVYRRWADLLRELLAAALLEAGEPVETPRQLRGAPPLEEPAVVGGEAFLAQLLAPARTGMILARDDLARAAREIGLGLRVGERRWVLEALLSQDAAATLRWLGNEAGRQGDLLAGWPPSASEPWIRRAHRTADLLARVAREAVSA